MNENSNQQYSLLQKYLSLEKEKAIGGNVFIYRFIITTIGFIIFESIYLIYCFTITGTTFDISSESNALLLTTLFLILPPFNMWIVGIIGIISPIILGIYFYILYFLIAKGITHFRNNYIK